MADHSDDDLVIIGETRCSRDNNSEEEVNESFEEDLDDLIVLDESVESGSRTSRADSDSVHLEVVTEVLPKECCREAQKQISELQSLVKKLEEENSRLEFKLRTSTEDTVKVDVVSDADATVKVVFRDKQLQNKFSSVVEAYIKSLLESEKNTHKSPEASASTSFFVDKYSHGDEKEEEVGEAWSIPLYDRVSGVLHSDNDEENKKDEPYYGPTCFNCGGNHTLRACTEPHNAMKISQNLRSFVGKQNSNKRYHLNSKYEALKPGDISGDLRSALDLKPNQLPSYVYRMRVLGYPPGWLKESEIQSSGLNLYDSDGKIVVDEENIEEGEVDLVEIKIQYDPSKLISFPGFNVPVPPSFKDEHRDYKMPPLQPHQLRSELEKSMKPPKATPYKKRKLSANTSSNSKRQKTDRLDEDMEIEITSTGIDVMDGTVSFRTPKSKRVLCLRLDSQSDGEDSTGSLPSTSSLDDRRASVDDKTDVEASPSLEALEERKRRLLKELDDKSDSQSDECAIISDGENPKNMVGCSVKNGKNAIGVTELSPVASNSTTVGDTLNSTPNGESNQAILKHSLSTTPGTPVVTLSTKLPDPSRFAIGVSEHIPFENLPSSTGTYEKMRAIIHKTRKLANSL